MSSTDHPILIAGGGIAGLTAALAFAAEGFSVRVFEAASELAEVGAGLQLSPNAAQCLESLGVLRHLKDRAVEPRAVVLHDANTLRRLTEIPLASNKARWGAPYIVAHRADVQRALLQSIQAEPRIQLIRGAQLVDAEFTAAGTRISLAHDGTSAHAAGKLLVGADGVWSSVRRFTSPEVIPESIFSGMTAWRTTVDRQQAEHLGFGDLVPLDCVSTFLDPRAHLVAYPTSGGQALNLVAITRGGSARRGWAHTDGRTALSAFLARLPAPLCTLNDLSSWTRWPLYSAPPRLPWTSTGLALIGDAAHAMLPFAAQGAGMAIEDAVVLATRVAQNPDNLARALAAYEADRRPRVEKVLARGRLNRTAWHASGPIALGRNLVFKLKGPQSLAADLDWLYGWKAPTK